jgi:putative ABC transport system substrate-binding protein
MRRRAFIKLLSGAATWPFVARAQQTGKVWRIGFLSGVSREIFTRSYAAFELGMRELGYVEGKDFVSEWRSAEGKYERLPELAAELVRLKVDILITGLTAGIRPLQQATSTIPIVMAYSVDPVGNHFVASLARPGGNTTGLAGSSDDTSPKQLELLAAVVTNPSRIGLLGNPASPTYSPVRNSAQDAAKKAGLFLVTIGARNLEEIENAFVAFAKERVQAVIVATDGVFFGQQKRIAEFALSSHLPTMFSQREHVEAVG